MFIIDENKIVRVNGKVIQHGGKFWKRHKHQLSKLIMECETIAEKMGLCRKSLSEEWEKLVLFCDLEEANVEVSHSHNCFWF